MDKHGGCSWQRSFGVWICKEWDSTWTPIVVSDQTTVWEEDMAYKIFLSRARENAQRNKNAICFWGGGVSPPRSKLPSALFCFSDSLRGC